MARGEGQGQPLNPARGRPAKVPHHPGAPGRYLLAAFRSRTSAKGEHEHPICASSGFPGWLLAVAATAGTFLFPAWSLCIFCAVGSPSGKMSANRGILISIPGPPISIQGLSLGRLQCSYSALHLFPCPVGTSDRSGFRCERWNRALVSPTGQSESSRCLPLPSMPSCAMTPRNGHIRAESP